MVWPSSCAGVTIWVRDVYELLFRHVPSAGRVVALSRMAVALTTGLALGMAAAEAEPEDMKTLQDAVGLLPSIATVIEKFDFKIAFILQNSIVV